MPAHTLTTEFMARLPSLVPDTGSVSYFDTDIKGFLLELRASGGATFYFRYRDASGKIRLSRIGRADHVSVSDARAKAHKMKIMLAEGGDPKGESHRFKDIPTLSAFVRDRYLPYIKTRKRSWRLDEAMLRLHILPVFGAQKMNRITCSDIIAFQHHVHEKKYAAGTCNRLMILLKFIYNCAIKWDVIPPDSNPCNGVDLFPDSGARERYLTQQEARLLFQELDHNKNTQVSQIIQLLLYTGARKREILDARWDEIDIHRHILTIPAARSKSKKPRHIPLSDAAITLLQSIPRENGVPWVFFNPVTKRPLVSIFYAWNSIRKKVGLPDVRLHDLRHSYASFLVNAGRSLYEVQKLLGHHDPKVTMRYAHLSPQAMLEAVNIIGNIVEQPMEGSLSTIAPKDINSVVT